MCRRLHRYVFAVLVFGLTALAAPAQSATEFCWKETWGTGAATRVPDLCGTNEERNGLFCYEKCKAGYTSNRIAGCIQNCPAGATDDGLFCGWPSYKAAEYPDWDKAKCEKNHKAVGCWRSGLLWVENCKPGYKHVIGFCEKKDIDCKALGLAGNRIANSCAKQTYGRDARTAKCPAGEEFDTGFCYKSCGANADRVGPLCWGKCPAGWVQCGMGCAPDSSKCNAATVDQIVSVLDSAASIAAMVGTMGASAAGKSMMSKAAWTGLKKIGKIQAKELLKNTAITLAVQTPSNIAKIASDSVDFIWDIGDIETNETMTEIEKRHAIAAISLNSISLIDPSGITGIVAAYTRPVCKDIAAARPPSAPPTAKGGILPQTTGTALVGSAEKGVKLNAEKAKAAQDRVAALEAAVKATKDATEKAKLEKELKDAKAELTAAANQVRVSTETLAKARAWAAQKK